MCGYFCVWIWNKIRHQIVSLMSCSVIFVIYYWLHWIWAYDVGSINILTSTFWIIFECICDFWWVRWESDFLDDWIAGNAWFLWVKLGWSGCFVLNNLYWFFEDFKWVRLKVDFTRVWGYFESVFDDF